jgi:hypothetical protein
VEERSSARTDERATSGPTDDRADFSRGRFVFGLVAIAVVAAAAAFGLGRLRAGPSLGRVVYASDHAVYERDLRSQAVRKLAALPSDTLEASSSVDGRWLAYIRRKGDLWLLDLDAGRRFKLSARLTAVLGWTPSGRLVAHELFAERDLVAVEPADRRPHLLLHGFPGGRIVWLGNDRFLWSGSGDLTLVTVGRRPSYRKILDDARVVAVSADGKDVLYVVRPSGRRPEVAVAANEGRTLKPRGIVFRGLAYRAAVSPQGFVALSGRDSEGRPGTWVLEGGRRAPRKVLDAQGESLAWSQDGSALLYLVDGAIFARDLRDGRTVRLTPHDRHVKAFAVVP